MPPAALSYYQGRVANLLVDAIVSTTLAVTGDGPSTEQMKGFDAIVNEARAGDESYLARLEKIYNDLRGEYVKHHNAILAQQDSLKVRESRLNVSIETWKYDALFLQIFGMIVG